MKLKKIVSFFMVFTLIFSSFPIAQAFAGTEMSINSKMGYMNFVKAIDPSISETNDGYYINDKKSVKDYIHKNLKKLQTIEGFENLSEKDIYNHITEAIKKSNISYKENKIKAEKFLQAEISSGQYAIVRASVNIPSGYYYCRDGEYSKDCWWGVSKLFITKSAMRVYARDLNAIALGVPIVAWMCGVLGWPAGFIGVITTGFGLMASDLNINAAYYDVLFLDIPWTIIPYSMYPG